MIRADSAEDLACAHLLSTADTDRLQVTVYRDIGSVTHHHHHVTAIANDCADLTIVDTTCLRTGATHDVDALVVERHAFQSIHVVLSEVAHDAIVTSDRHWQSPAVSFEAIVHHAVNGRELLCLLVLLLHLLDLLLRALCVDLLFQLSSTAHRLCLTGCLLSSRLTCLSLALRSLTGCELTGSNLLSRTLIGQRLCGSLLTGLCRSSLTGTLCSHLCQGSLTGLLLELSLTLTGLSNTARILARSGFGSSLSLCQQGSTPFGGSLSGSLTLRLGGSTGTHLLHLYLHELVDLGVECGIFLMLFSNNGLYRLLLLLQAGHHLLLFCLVAFELALLLLSFI